jgi:succinate dehydrogenase/fumarate reductase cytochrome b subunit
MTEPLGDKIFTWLIYIFAASWFLGWIFLLLIMLFEKLFPSSEQKGESFLKTMAKYISPIMKYSLIAAGVLFLIHLLATWLGWANK